MPSHYAIAFLCAFCCTRLLSAQTTQPADPRTAPPLEGLGTHHFPITIGSKEAQRYFDQGLIRADVKLTSSRF